jgi:hypothetical protein
MKKIIDDLLGHLPADKIDQVRDVLGKKYS